MQPFDSYPHGGRQLLGKRRGANCRHEYGLELQRLSGQTMCAYCGQSLIDAYTHWLLMSVDHVVPTKAGRALGIRTEWLGDRCNTVLCCSACNGFGNRYQLPVNTPPPESLDAFINLRDATFAERRALILECHEKERCFFVGKPWEKVS